MEEVRTLQQIVREDRVDDLIAAIRGGLNVNTVYPNVGTALHFACEGGGREKCLDLLLKHEEIDVNLRNGANQTPLHIAARGGHVECATLLLEKRALILPGFQGWNPLHLAAYHGHLQMLQLVLPLSPVDELNDARRTALCQAVMMGKRECADLLVDAGAKLEYLRSELPNIPTWLECLYARRRNVLNSYLVLYGVLRRRVTFTTCGKKIRVPRDMVRLITQLLYATRRNPAWDTTNSAN